MDTQPFFQDEGAGKKCLYPGPIGKDGDALRAFPCAVSLAQDVNRTANVLLLHEDECKKALENRVLQRQ